MAGIDDRARARFQLGSAEFSEVESAAEGLGPLFNGNSCAQCHNTPSPGGAGLMRVMRAACRTDTSLSASGDGDSLIHLFSTRPDLGAAGVISSCDATIAQRRTTSLFGIGLIEAIPDAELEAEADSQPQALRGRVAHITDIASGDERAGKLGWKAQHATLESFAGDAYRNEMGITNALFPDEVAPHGDHKVLALMDAVPDPEAENGAIGKLSDFMRLLAPPEPVAEEEQGRELFEQLGCDTCHRQSYVSESSVHALEGKTVALYSDLLLHDIGTGDGIAQADASADEFRTAPLWGTRHAQLWLHDGRAPSMDAAIRAHAGQASEVSRAYAELEDEDREAVLAFLRSL